MRSQDMFHQGSRMCLMVVATLFGNGPPSYAQTDEQPSKFETALSQNCALKGEVPPQRFTFEVKLQGNETASAFHLTQIFCERAAYNTSEIWILKNEFDGEQVLSFAVPELNVSYADGSEQKTVEDIVVTGYASETRLSNSSFDPETMTISSFHKWRGVGDASNSGSWEFREGRFVLKSYEVDASFDGEINPQSVADYERPTP